ncbi:MAG: hypothetical protein HY459_01400 [Parcubacteria group bacterium]|nr:hypothetical protein [Parcubacteria group bacterium]
MVKEFRSWLLEGTDGLPALILFPCFSFILAMTLNLIAVGIGIGVTLLLLKWGLPLDRDALWIGMSLFFASVLAWVGWNSVHQRSLAGDPFIVRIVIATAYILGATFVFYLINGRPVILLIVVAIHVGLFTLFSRSFMGRLHAGLDDVLDSLYEAW